MPDATPSSVPGANPGMTPQQPGASPPVKPPFGSTPSVTPMQNPGLEMAGMQRLGVALRIISEALPMVGASSEMGKSALDAIKALSKHIKPGTVSPAGEQNQLQKAQLQAAQNAGMLQRLKAMQMAGGPGGAPKPGMMPPQQPPVPAAGAA